MKKILVTGGAGYIGSHTCKELAKCGFEPVVFDNLVYGHKDFVKWGPFIQGDLQDQILLKKTFKDFKIDAVIHFAAYAYVGESVSDPQKYYHNNVTGSLSLLNAMKDAGLDKIIFSSSCATYGIPTSLPIEETNAQVPINPYGFSKLVVERAIKDYSQAYGLNSIILRYFNVAGADPEGELWEDHDPETHLIPNAVAATNEGGAELKLFGTDYKTKDGTCIRDYIHVADVARAHLLALQKLFNMTGVEIFNLGNGAGFSVLEVIRAVEDVLGKKVKYHAVESRVGDPAVLIANWSKAKNKLGWQPQYSSLNSIISTLKKRE